MAYRLITADSTVELRKGSLKVETPFGVFLITVGDEIDGRVYNTVVAYPSIHPGEKKVLVKNGKNYLQLVRCKVSKHRGR